MTICLIHWRAHRGALHSHAKHACTVESTTTTRADQLLTTQHTTQPAMTANQQVYSQSGQAGGDWR